MLAHKKNFLKGKLDQYAVLRINRLFMAIWQYVEIIFSLLFFKNEKKEPFMTFNIVSSN